MSEDRDVRRRQRALQNLPLAEVPTDTWDHHVTFFT